MGLTGLENLPRLLEANLRVHEMYLEGLADVPGVKLVTFDRGESNNYQYIVIEVDETRAGLTRDQLEAILSAENIQTRRYFSPACHHLPPYRQRAATLPETESLSNRVLALPGGASLRQSVVGAICQLISVAVEHSQAIQRKWAPELFHNDKAAVDVLQA